MRKSSSSYKKYFPKIYSENLYCYYAKYRFIIGYFLLIFTVSTLPNCKKKELSPEQSEYFTKFFGSSGINQGNDVIQTNDGGYVILGTTTASGKGTDILLIKTDKFGNMLWNHSFGDSLNDFAKSLKQTTDDGFIILGTTTTKIQQNTQTDMYLIKTNNLGFQLWSKKIGGSDNQEGNCVLSANDNNYILVGSTTSETSQNPQGKKNMFIVKTNSSGDSIVSQSFGGENDDTGTFIQQKADNNFVVIGSTETYKELGLNLSNIIIWDIKNSITHTTDAPISGSNQDDYGECIQKLNDNSFVLTGTTTNSDNTSGFFVIKYSTNSIRNIAWSKIYESGLKNASKYIYPTSDNGFILTGTSSKDGSNSLCLLKISSEGNLEFTKYFGLLGADETGNCVKQTSDGGYIIVGTNSYEGPSMITLIKTNSSGNQK